jgi:Predicted double-stranded RNA/RNA-DNA hybrid binding protein
MSKKKHYVVWKGGIPGVYSSWEECKKQVEGFEGALYKSFDSKESANAAFRQNPWISLGKNKSPQPAKGNFIRDSLAVDAACSGNPGKMEYRGVYVATGQELFRIGPYEEGTNNIGEFLAIVHGLAFLKQQNKTIPIYSDSVNAMLWVKKKKCNTKLEPTERNKEIFELISRAEKWLQNNTYNTPIIKWKTEEWGEIPADFGRK